MSILSGVEPIAAVLERPHGLLEGPRFDGDDVVYSDVTGGGVWRATPGGRIEPVVPKRRGIGGVVLHASGGVVVGGRTLIHQPPGNAEAVVLHDGAGLAGFNDLTVAPDGAVIAGALRFRPMGGEAPVPGLLLRITGPGEAEVLSEALLWPNGIAYPPGGAALYAADYATKTVLAIAADGSGHSEFCAAPHGSCDGLAVDVDGGVWVAAGEGGGVARFTADGVLDEFVDVPAGFVSSIAFGGEDGRDVLITTADNTVTPETGGVILRARSTVAGVPVPRTSI